MSTSSIRPGAKLSESAGFEPGPSNFFFYTSGGPLNNKDALSDQLDWERGIHMNRGDGEGPGEPLASPMRPYVPA